MKQSLIYAFIHSVNKHLPQACYVLGRGWSTKDTITSKLFKEYSQGDGHTHSNN